MAHRIAHQIAQSPDTPTECAAGFTAPLIVPADLFQFHGDYKSSRLAGLTELKCRSLCVAGKKLEAGKSNEKNCRNRLCVNPAKLAE